MVNEFNGRLWPSILEFNVNLDAQLTSKSNFIFGASTVLLLFLLNSLLTKNNYAALPWGRKMGIGILILGSILAAGLSLMVVLPKIRILSDKERIREDIFYYKNIRQFYTREKYVRHLQNLVYDEDGIAKAYAHQIYSLATNILSYKFKMLKWSGWTLITCLVLGLLFLVA